MVCSSGIDSVQPNFINVFKLVLLDIDGTLIHSAGAGSEAFCKVLEHVFQKEPSQLREKSFAGRTDLSLVSEVFQDYNIPETQQNFQRFWEIYPHLLHHYMPRFPGQQLDGAEQFVQAFYRWNPRPMIGLLTGNIRIGAEIKLRHFGLWSYFEMGAFGCEHAQRNELSILAKRKAERALGEDLRGDQILIVGDTPSDIEAAKYIDARCLAVGSGEYSQEMLQRHQPDWAVKSLLEVYPTPLEFNGF